LRCSDDKVLAEWESGSRSNGRAMSSSIPTGSYSVCRLAWGSPL
jgi:hypothetical protein